jgi:DNA polymerase III subunit delta'
MPFERIIGHKSIVSLLRRASASGRLSHAYLFDGIDSQGMMDTALALVESIFCASGGGCGECPACRNVASGRHPDLHLLQPDGTFIKIDQIRELQKEISFRPYEARKKACIIEDADRMNPAAANAFLKTLEEPPGEALLILLTSHAEGMLPTIISRCQHIRFRPLPMEIITAHLREGGAEEEPARIAAALAGGSMIRAREIVDGDWLQVRKQLLERVVRLSTGDIAPLFSAAEEYTSNKEGALAVIDILKLFWRDSLLVHEGIEEITNGDLLPLVRETNRHCSLESVMEKLERISHARQALLRNVNPRLAMETLFMDLAENGQ